MEGILMNLYEIMMEHYAPKDSEKGIHTYLVANSDEEVYEWLKLEKELKDGRQIFLSWSYKEDEETFDIYDEDYNVIGVESFKEKMIRIKGDLNDEDVELTDLYYGRTLVGWYLVKENITGEEIGILASAGISLESF
jgi:hypothetical protein